MTDINTQDSGYGAEVKVFTNGQVMISQKVIIFGTPPEGWLPFETKATVSRKCWTPQGEVTQNFSRPVRFDADSPEEALAVAPELIDYTKQQIEAEIDGEQKKPVTAPAGLLDARGRLINRGDRRSRRSNGQ